MQTLQVKVFENSGRAPQRFSIANRSIGVAEVIDRWFGPDHCYYKLRGEDGAIYILRYDDPTHTWDLTLFDCGRSEATRLSST